MCGIWSWATKEWYLASGRLILCSDKGCGTRVSESAREGAGQVLHAVDDARRLAAHDSRLVTHVTWPVRGVSRHRAEVSWPVWGDGCDNGGGSSGLHPLLVGRGEAESSAAGPDSDGPKVA